MRQRNESEATGRDGWAQMDVILPEQLASKPTALDDPERRLRLAVLEDAIREIERCRAMPSLGRRGEEALSWIASEDRAEPFAFENVCDALDLDPDYIRRGVCRWWQAQPAGGARSRSLPRFVSRRVQPRPRVDRRRAA